MSNVAEVQVETPVAAEKVSKKKSLTKAGKKSSSRKKSATASPSLNGEARAYRAKVVEALRKLHATSPSTAVPLDKVAEKLGGGATRRDAYRHIAGASGKAGSSPTCLMATGHVKTTDGVEGRGVGAYLTKKGQEADLKKSPFAKA